MMSSGQQGEGCGAPNLGNTSYPTSSQNQTRISLPPMGPLARKEGRFQTVPRSCQVRSSFFCLQNYPGRVRAPVAKTCSKRGSGYGWLVSKQEAMRGVVAKPPSRYAPPAWVHECRVTHGLRSVAE